jgi:hypothetical protein
MTTFVIALGLLSLAGIVWTLSKEAERRTYRRQLALLRRLYWLQTTAPLQKPMGTVTTRRAA